MALSEGNENLMVFAQVLKTDVRYIKIILEIGDQFHPEVELSREAIDYVGASDGRPNTIINTNKINGWYLSGRTQISADSREPLLVNPTYAYTDFRRLASRYGIFIWLEENTAQTHWRGPAVLLQQRPGCEAVSGRRLPRLGERPMAIRYFVEDSSEVIQERHGLRRGAYPS